MSQVHQDLPDHVVHLELDLDTAAVVVVAVAAAAASVVAATAAAATAEAGAIQCRPSIHIWHLLLDPEVCLDHLDHRAIVSPAPMVVDQVALETISNN